MFSVLITPAPFVTQQCDDEKNLHWDQALVVPLVPSSFRPVIPTVAGSEAARMTGFESVQHHIDGIDIALPFGLASTSRPTAFHRWM